MIDALIALVLHQQTPPPSPVTMDSPARSTITAAYECQERDVEFRYDATGWPSPEPRGVWFRSYRSGDVVMPPARLAQINERLAPIKRLKTVEFQCQRPHFASLQVVGVDETGREVRANIRVDGSETYITLHH